MTSRRRKRSFEEFADQDRGTTHQDKQDSDMAKRSRHSHPARKADTVRSQDKQTGAEGKNKPGLQFASHKLNSSVKVTDLRDLVLYCLADGVAPSWISVQNKAQFQKAVVLLVPGLEKSMFDGSLLLEPSSATLADDAVNVGLSAEPGAIKGDQNGGDESRAAKPVEVDRDGPDNFLPFRLEETKLQTPLKPLAGVFDHMWPIKATGDSRFSKVHSPLHSMLQRPVSETAEEKNKRKHSKGARPPKLRDDFTGKQTPITEFIATVEDLRDNGYIVHPAVLRDDAEKKEELERRERLSTTSLTGWRDALVDTTSNSTKIEINATISHEVTDGRTVYAVDCEMCMVGEDEYALTRISIIRWDGEMIMDELVKPDKPIINYLTQYSGISEEMLKDVNTNLADIQDRLLNLFTADTILVGHSLESDLKALKFTHPFIVDTSIIYPHPRGPPMKSSLKWLCQKYLNREIQKGHGSKGHNSIEDARACLDLVRLKCEKGKQWGTADASNESIFKTLGKKPKSGQFSGIATGKQGAIVDLGTPERNFGQQAAFSIGCKDDDGVVEAVKRCVLGDPDGEYIPGGGIELTWARLRELDYLRGWANNNRNDGPLTRSVGPSTNDLSAAASRTIARIVTIREYLPPCTLMIVYSGTGDPKELGRLQDLERQFKKEYTIKKWDELTVKWTDTEAQALKTACEVARAGIGLITLRYALTADTSVLEFKSVRNAVEEFLKRNDDIFSKALGIPYH